MQCDNRYYLFLCHVLLRCLTPMDSVVSIRRIWYDTTEKHTICSISESQARYNYSCVLLVCRIAGWLFFRQSCRQYSFLNDAQSDLCFCVDQWPGGCAVALSILRCCGFCMRNMGVCPTLFPKGFSVCVSFRIGKCILWRCRMVDPFAVAFC